jgi:hypothetical protein
VLTTGRRLRESIERKCDDEADCNPLGLRDGMFSTPDLTCAEVRNLSIALVTGYATCEARPYLRQKLYHLEAGAIDPSLRHRCYQAHHAGLGAKWSAWRDRRSRDGRR